MSKEKAKMMFCRNFEQKMEGKLFLTFKYIIKFNILFLDDCFN
jgi:hypothetical protein